MENLGLVQSKPHVGGHEGYLGNRAYCTRHLTAIILSNLVNNKIRKIGWGKKGRLVKSKALREKQERPYKVVGSKVRPQGISDRSAIKNIPNKDNKICNV